MRRRAHRRLTRDAPSWRTIEEVLGIGILPCAPAPKWLRSPGCASPSSPTARPSTDTYARGACALPHRLAVDARRCRADPMHAFTSEQPSAGARQLRIICSPVRAPTGGRDAFSGAPDRPMASTAGSARGSAEAGRRDSFHAFPSRGRADAALWRSGSATLLLAGHPLTHERSLVSPASAKLTRLGFEPPRRNRIQDVALAAATFGNARYQLEAMLDTRRPAQARTPAGSTVSNRSS